MKPIILTIQDITDTLSNHARRLGLTPNALYKRWRKGQNLNRPHIPREQRGHGQDPDHPWRR